MSNQPVKSPSRRILQLTIGVLIALSFVAMAIPQNAQASPYYHCNAWHLVKKGERKPQIAKTYDLDWRKIAWANNLRMSTKLRVGQRLCIPGDATIVNSLTPSKATKNVTIESYKDRISIEVSGFGKKNLFYVKARDLTSGVGKWHRLGKMKVNRWGIVTRNYYLPEKLRDSIDLEVCLKNAHTNKTICRKVSDLYP